MFDKMKPFEGTAGSYPFDLLRLVQRIDDGMRMPISDGITATIILEGGKWTPENIDKLCAYLAILKTALQPEE